ncbi:MAG: hypothetical protein ACLSH6_10190 [Limosilactobacillus pontis]
MTNKIENSPAARITALADSFKDVSKARQHYVDLLDQLASTDQAEELLSAAGKLTEQDLHNAFIDFPQHYQAADYCMLFMGRQRCITYPVLRSMKTTSTSLWLPLTR